MVLDSALWRRVDRPGHDAASLRALDDGWLLTGTSVFAESGEACHLAYRVECDSEWRTVRATVTGWHGRRSIETIICADAHRRWTLDGQHIPDVDDCPDVDLSFTPATNLLPIRRLGLAVGQQAAVRSAWFRFPEHTLALLSQTYRRTDERHYAYALATGGFAAILTVDRAGFCLVYPGLWEQVVDRPAA